MKFKIITLGCKVNQYESESIAATLKESGIRRAEKDESADIVIVNSCTVTAASDQKVRQCLRREKKENPNAAMVLTGCMAQAFPEKSEELPEADVILGTANRARLLPHVLSFLGNRQRIVDISPHQAGEKFEPMKIDEFADRTRAYIKIQDGCNRFCSYCIIPFARGRVRSKPLRELQDEVQSLADNGYREVVLTGINLSAYGQDLGLELCDAVEAACAVPNISRVRLGSLEPEQLTPPVIARMAKEEKLCPQFHLSLQSGCDETLKRMNRHYTATEYQKIVADLRLAFPGAAITTDIMVGFCGETEGEFEASLRFAETIAFAQTHVFAYSRRPSTKAYDLPDQISNHVKEERSKKMIAVSRKAQYAFCNAQVGKIEEVLFEQRLDGELYEGHTRNYVTVAAPSDKNLHGQLLSVTITAADRGLCRGYLTK
ncbi:MAG: tRNA (N(6)-L-threonylcarbamoyladenosine(37)-C(2))-methylthiotransferase MtaB [Oscillospiraceae bacterium]